VVAEVDAVRRRFKHDFVQADDIALAEGSDLQGFSLGARLTDYLLDRDGSARGGVFLMDVMTLENLAGVVMAQGGGSGASDVEEKIHPHGKVRSVDESRAVLRDQRFYPVKIFVPA